MHEEWQVKSMPLLKNNVYALNRLTKHRLKNGQISTSWQASYRHTIATCNFRNFTSNEKLCAGLVLIVSIFLSVWPHSKNHKFLRIVYKRLPCDPRSLLSVYRSHLSELNTGIFCLISQITLGQFAIFFSIIQVLPYNSAVQLYISVWQQMPLF